MAATQTFNNTVVNALSFTGAGTGLTGTAASLTAGNVTTNANLTGVITSVGNATSIASQTGTGTKFVVDTSPTLVTPTLGVAAATSITINSGTAISNFVENSFVPTIEGSVTAGTPTYVRQSGLYKRENNRVDVYINVAWSATTGMVGNLLVGGLPFTSRNTAGLISTFVSAVGTDTVAMLFAPQYVPMFVLSPNLTKIAVTAMDGVGGGFSPFGIQNGSVAIQGYYYI